MIFRTLRHYRTGLLSGPGDEALVGPGLSPKPSSSPPASPELVRTDTVGTECPASNATRRVLRACGFGPKERQNSMKTPVHPKIRHPLTPVWLVCSVFAVGCGAEPASTTARTHLEKATPEHAGGSAPTSAAETAPSTDGAVSDSLGDPSNSSPAASPSAPPSTSDPPTPPPTGDPTEDDLELNSVKRDGWLTTWIARTCVSKKDGEPTIEDAPLPVGGGRRLECMTASNPSPYSVQEVHSVGGDDWCVLGESVSWERWGDSALKISVTSTPDLAPWSLVATHDGNEILISPAAGPFGIGEAWPVGVRVKYKVIDMKPNPQSKLFCEQIFNL